MEVFWISTSKGLFHYTDRTLKNITAGITEDFKGTGSIIQDSKGIFVQFQLA